MLLCPTAFFFQFFNLGYTLCSSTSLRESTDPSHNTIPYICLGAKLTTSSIYPQISNGPLKRDQVQRTKDVHWLFTPTFSFGIPGFFNQDSKGNNGKPALDGSPLSPSDCSVAGFSGQQHDAASMVGSRSEFPRPKSITETESLPLFYVARKIVNQISSWYPLLLDINSTWMQELSKWFSQFVRATKKFVGTHVLSRRHESYNPNIITDLEEKKNADSYQIKQQNIGLKSSPDLHIDTESVSVSASDCHLSAVSSCTAGRTQTHTHTYIHTQTHTQAASTSSGTHTQTHTNTNTNSHRALTDAPLESVPRHGPDSATHSTTPASVSAPIPVPVPPSDQDPDLIPKPTSVLPLLIPTQPAPPPPPHEVSTPIPPPAAARTGRELPILRRFPTSNVAGSDTTSPSPSSSSDPPSPPLSTSDTSTDPPLSDPPSLSLSPLPIAAVGESTQPPDSKQKDTLMPGEIFGITLIAVMTLILGIFLINRYY